MAAINQIISLGIGSPSGISPFITVGFELGGALVTVPDVLGDTQAVATATLEGDGFVVAVQYVYDDPGTAGLVVDQSPTAGSSAETGSTVTIVVSIGAAPVSDGSPRNGRDRGLLRPLFGRG